MVAFQGLFKATASDRPRARPSLAPDARPCSMQDRTPCFTNMLIAGTYKGRSGWALLKSLLARTANPSPGHGLVIPSGKFCGSTRIGSVATVFPQIFQIGRAH